MKKILFYSSNGVGLGHLRRVSLIVRELNSNKLEITLVTLSQAPQLFGKFFNHLVKLQFLSDDLLKDKRGTKGIRLANGLKFAQAIKKFKPEIIVSDFYLDSPFTFSAFQYALDQSLTKSIFIWRLGSKYKNSGDFRDKNDKFRYFKKVIIPHTFEEVKNLLPLSIFRKIEKDDKFSIIGPIFKKPNQMKLSSCRKRYKISSKDFFITISLGGGGELKAGKCESSRRIIKSFLDIYPQLLEAIPNLKVVISTGPYFMDSKRKSLPQLVKFIKFEEDFTELIKISDLVISTAGYNTCNELINTRTPAVLIPLLRGDKEQFERACYLERKGVAKVFKNGSSNELLKLIFNVKDNLNRMKLNFRKFSDWQYGNLKAAKIILGLLNKQ